MKNILTILLLFTSLLLVGQPTDYVAYYPFNGNANDESGNGNDGTVTGASPASDRSFNANAAYEFGSGAGVDDINFGDVTVIDGVQQMTVNVWIYPTSYSATTDATSFRTILTKWDPDGGGNNTFDIRFQGDGAGGRELAFGIANTFAEGAIDATLVPLNQWSLLSMRWTDAAATELFLNGVLAGTCNCTLNGSTANIANNMYAGWSERATEEGFLGIIDDIRIYDRSLTGEEILALYQEDAFVTTWQTTSANESITIPTTGSGYNYTVDWGDGTVETGFVGDASHSYSSAGTYTVSITGEFPRIYFNSTGDREKIMTIEQWGEINWSSMNRAFAGCSNLTYNATDAPDLSNVFVMFNMFQNCTSFNGNLDSWDVSNVNNLFGAFRGCSVFNQPLNSWNVSNVTDFEFMFQDALLFDQPLNNWNMSSASSLRAMFDGASSFNQSVEAWNVSGISNMSFLFRDASSFNQPLANWQVTSVSQIEAMFQGATAFNQPLNDWVLSSLTFMPQAFENATSFNQPLDNWNVSSVNNMFALFKDASAFDQDLSAWNIGGVTQNLASMQEMFDNSNMSVDNYDATIIGWATLDAGESQIPSDITLGASGISYCQSESARNDLVTTFNWAISGDMKDCEISVTSTTPSSNEPNVSRSSTIVLNFNGAVSQSSIDNSTTGNPLDDNIIITGDQTGLISGSYSGDGTNSITFTPSSSFEPGEIITVTVTNSVMSSGAEVSKPMSFKFNVSTGYGSGSFENEVTLISETNGVTDVFAHDVNSDGNMDIISCVFNDDKVSWLENDGNQGFTEHVVTTLADGVIAVHAEDIDQDGDIDLLSSNRFGFNISWYENNGNEVFTKNDIALSVFTPIDLYTVDLDSDGDMDIVAAASANDKVAWLQNDGNQSFTQIDIATTFDGPSSVYPADVNDDGFMDILVASSVDNRLTLLINDGSQNFSESIISTSLDGVQFVRGMDINGDGSLDLVTASVNDDQVAWYENNGNEVFTEVSISSNATEAREVYSADINGDGSLDIVSFAQIGTNNRMLWFQNDGSESFTEQVIPTVSNNIRGGFPVDLDNDGDLDIIGANSGGLTFHEQTGDGFVTTWQTTTASESITIPTFSGETYNYSVDWGDGTVENGFTGDASHTYATAGTYTVSIYGTFPRIYFNFASEGQQIDKIQSIEQWGDISWTAMNQAFAGCSNLAINASDAPNFSGVTDLTEMFASSGIVGGLSSWDMSNITSIHRMFTGAGSFNDDLSGWNVSNVFDMYAMFEGASNFNGNISTWDVSSVISMAYMFNGCSVFNQDISLWQTNALTTTQGMFLNAPLFNQDISGWNVSSVTIMESMFYGASAFNQNLDGWNVSAVTDMSSMFRGATSFNQSLNSWDVSNATTLAFMFADATSFNGDITGWNTASLVDMPIIFFGASSFNQDISGWDVSRVQNFGQSFVGATSFNQDLGSWDISSANNLESMFDGTALSVANYDNILQGFARLDEGEVAIPSNLTLGAGGLQYCEGVLARDELINTYGWTVLDAGQNCTDLVAYYTFDGNATDRSGNANNGTLGDGATSSTFPTSTFDRLGEADATYQFDGVDDYITVPNDLIGGASNVTISWWQKIANPVDGARVLSLASFRAYLNSGNIVIQPFIGGSATQMGTSVASNEWQHFTFTYDGVTKILYRNGVEATTQAASGVFDTGGVGFIGATNSTTNFLDGFVDDIRVYTSAFSAAEVLAIYEEEKAPPLQDGLVAYYPFNNNELDESGSGNDGTNNGGTSVADRFGNANAAFGLDGVDDYIVVADDNSLDLNQFTLSGWMFLNNAVPNGSFYNLFFKGAPSDPENTNYALSVNSNQKLGMFYEYGSGTNVILTGTTTLQAGEWYHLSTTYDGGELKLYVNGVEDGNLAESNAPEPNDVPMYMGTNNGLTSFVNGSLDDLRMYNRALSSSEIQDLYDSEKPLAVQDGLLVAYEMDGNAADASGNANNGVLNGPTPTTDRFDMAEGALAFDGNDDGIFVTSLGSEPANITLSAWFKYPAGTGGDTQNIFEIVGASVLAVLQDQAQTVVNLNSNFLTRETPVEPDIWHLLNLTYDGSSYNSYLDGVAYDISANTDGLTYFANEINIGNAGGSSNFFQGSMDQVRVYDRALSASEIEELYLEGNWTDIISFSFDGQTGPASIDHVNRTIDIEVEHGVNIHTLVPNFTTLSSFEVFFNGGLVTSGATSIDFTDPITLDVVYSANTSVSAASYVVNVTQNHPVAINFEKITTTPITQDYSWDPGNTWADFNNDNYPDLFLATWDFVSPTTFSNRLYLNDQAGGFTDASSALPVDSWEVGNAVDFDNDGDIDIVGPSESNDWADGANKLFFVNNGNASGFTRQDLTIPSTIDAASRLTWNSGWADYDNDGDLDVLHLQEVDAGVNKFFVNNGDGTFTENTSINIANNAGSSLDVSWADINNDGNIDLFVANNGSNVSSTDNELYINNGDGTFTQVLSGDIVTDGVDSEGISWGDINNDGFLDLLVPGIDTVLMFQNNGDNTFTTLVNSITQAGLRPIGSTFGDYDNDGDLDIFMTELNGINRLWENDGTGTFTEVTGTLLNEAAASWSANFVDYDRDGALDLFVTNGEQKNYLYRNTDTGNGYLSIKLRGAESNRSGLGARIVVSSEISGAGTGEVQQTRQVLSTSGSRSQNETTIHFGVGAAPVIDNITVYWPSGRVNSINSLSPNQFISIDENTGLLLFYPFNANTQDESTNGLFGNAEGGLTLTTDRFGNADQAYVFDGVDDRIVTTNIPQPEAITLSGWLQTTADYTGGYANILEVQGAAGLGISGSNNEISASLQIGEGNFVTIKSSSDIINDGLWHLLAVSYDGSSIKLYLDGNLVNEITDQTAGIFYPQDVVNIGYSNDGIDRWFNGKIDELRVFDRALTLEEIGQLYTGRPFITSWQTTTNNESINIPIGLDGEVYDYTVDWGDGTVVTGYTADATHEYATAGTYTVSVFGKFPRIYFNDGVEGQMKDKILTVEQWGDQEWTSMRGAFEGCTNLTVPATDAPDLTQVTDMFRMFYGATSMNNPVDHWDVSNVSTMAAMFEGAVLFNQPLNSWNTSSATDMLAMFNGATAFNQDLSNWNVSNVEVMTALFNTSGFDQSLASWDISSVTTMETMFSNSAMSKSNYDLTLEGWAFQSGGEARIPTGVLLGVDGLTYCNGASARNTLATTYSWDIQGDSESCTLDDGLIIYYPFSGSTVDESGNDLNPTTDDGTLGTDRLGNANSAYADDGTGTGISIVNANDFDFERYTYMSWFKVDGTNGDYTLAYFLGGSDIRLNTGSIDFFDGSCNPTTVQKGQGSLTTDWHHLAVTFDYESGAEIYLDGMSLGLENLTGCSPQDASELRIGYLDGANSSVLNGLFDEIRLYNRVLSNQDIQTIYDQEKPPTTLVAYYPFNGDANDASGNGNNGTVNGATPTNDRFGEANRAYIFDGNNDYIEVPNAASLQLTSALTVSAWVQLSAVSADQAVVHKGREGTIEYLLNVFGTSRGEPGVLEFGSQSFDFVTSTTRVDDGNLHHIVGTLRNGDIYVYVDGVLENSMSVSGNLFGGDGSLTIGALDNPTKDRFANGVIDDVRVYNIGLTDAEVLALYNQESPQPSSEALITSFTIPNQVDQTSINDNAGTISLTMPEGTTVTSLTPTITFSAGASISPESGVAQDFTNSVDYTVTAEDGVTMKTYTVTVNVESSVNNPPTDIALSNSQVTEALSIGTNVGQFSTTDLDQDDTHTYSLVAGTGDSGNGSFNLSALGLLTTAEVFDAGVQSSYSIRVQTDDGGDNGTYQESFTITILPEGTGSDPTEINLSANSINENAAIGTTIGTFSTLDPDDPDGNDTYNYAIVSGNTDVLGISGDALVTADFLDFETTTSYPITVRTTDPGGRSLDVNFTINVTNDNEAPVLNAFTGSVAENAAAGTAIGTLSASDPDGETNLTFSLVDNTSNFGLEVQDGTNVILRVAESGRSLLDYETRQSLNVQVRVEDAGNLTDTQTISFAITNENPQPGDLILSNAAILAGAAGGTKIGDLAMGGDEAKSSFEYSIAGGGSEFTIDGSQLLINEGVGTGNYSITINAQNNVGGSSIDSDQVQGAFTIEVTSISTSGKVSFGTDISNYRIIGIPTSSARISDVFPNLAQDDQGTGWRIVSWTNNDFSDLTTTGRSMTAGQGYWFLSSTSTDIVLNGLTPIQDAEVSVNLQSGWNLISNPFLDRLNVTNAIAYNVNQGFIQDGDVSRVYDYSPQLVDELDEFEGGWIENTTGGTISLILPNPSTNAFGRVGTEGRSVQDSWLESQDNWQLVLFMQDAQRRSNLGAIGMRQTSTAGRDKLDYAAPPVIADDLTFMMVDSYGLVRNFKPQQNAQEWAFGIAAPRHNRVTLSWDAEMVKRLDRKLYLYDPVENASYNMAAISSIELPANSSFEVLYGDAVDDKTIQLPLLIYPNPAVDKVSVQFYVEGEAMEIPAKLTIFGIDGRIVKELRQYVASNSLATFLLDDLDLSSGTYLLQVSSDGKNSQPKKLIVK